MQILFMVHSYITDITVWAYLLPIEIQDLTVLCLEATDARFFTVVLFPFVSWCSSLCIHTYVLCFCIEMCYFKIKIAILTKMIVICFSDFLSVKPRYISELCNTHECGKWWGLNVAATAKYPAHQTVIIHTCNHETLSVFKYVSM